jgi:hypothetical protein
MCPAGRRLPVRGAWLAVDAKADAADGFIAH